MHRYNRAERRYRKHAATRKRLLMRDFLRSLPLPALAREKEVDRVAIVGGGYDFSKLRQQFANAIGVPRELLFPRNAADSSAVKEKEFRDSVVRRCLENPTDFIKPT